MIEYVFMEERNVFGQTAVALEADLRQGRKPFFYENIFNKY